MGKIVENSENSEKQISAKKKKKEFTIKQDFCRNRKALRKVYVFWKCILVIQSEEPKFF